MRNRNLLCIVVGLAVAILVSFMVVAQDWVRPNPDDYVFNEIVIIRDT